MLVTAEPDVGAVDVGVAVVHSERLQADIGDGVPAVGRDDRSHHRECLSEWKSEPLVVGVHQRVAARLEFGDPGAVMEVVGARAPGRDDVAADLVVRHAKECHRRLDPLALVGSVLDHHQVALVAHHASDDEPTTSRFVGEATGPLGRASAAGEPHVHVDHARADSGQCGGVDRRLAVDRDRDVGVVGQRRQRTEATGIENLVGDQQVLTHPGRGHADRLAWRGAGERSMTESVLVTGDRRALVCLHMRTQPATGVGSCHRLQIGVEEIGVDDERGRRQIVDEHRWCRTSAGSVVLGAGLDQLDQDAASVLGVDEVDA